MNVHTSPDASILQFPREKTETLCLVEWLTRLENFYYYL